MPENYTPSGGVGSALIRATSAEATGDFGADFMRTNVTRLADKARFLADDGTISEDSLVAPTLLNSWANTGGSFRNTGYYKGRDGRVYLAGMVSGGASGSIAFVLPSGYRPTTNAVRIVTTATGAYAHIEVDTAGNVYCFGGTTNFSFEGLSFRP